MTQTVIPYLTVNNAAEAITFYEKAFGASEESRLATDDGKRIMHAALGLQGGTVYLADEFPEHGGAPAPTAERPSPVGVAIALGAPADVDALFRRAVEAGATGSMEPADMFWGGRFAMLHDPFGHRWMLNAPLNQG